MKKSSTTNDQDLHTQLIDYLKPLLTHDPDDDEKLLRGVFRNYSNGPNGRKGLRLSKPGLFLCKKSFQSWSFDHSTRINFEMLYQLDKKLTWPYYIDKRSITLFSHEDAALYTLAGGLEDFLSTI